MRIAYVSSLYPAVSQTFIAREVTELQARGFEIDTYSIRRVPADECHEGRLKDDARTTRWLVPAHPSTFARAVMWAVFTRPLRTLKTFGTAVLPRESAYEGRLKWIAYFLEAIQLAHWVTRDKVDHLHCHFGNNGASATMLAAVLSGIPYSVTCHGSELREPKRFRLRDKVRHAAFVACVSQFGRAQLMLTCPVDQWEKLMVVRCGVPLRDAAMVPEPPRHDGVPEILCVARLSREKGHLVLLEALARLRDDAVPFRCTLVGDGPMRGPIEERRAKLGLQQLVTLGGSVAPERMDERYLAASLVVLSSFSEGVPVVLMEAIAHCRPVIATPVGGIPELVEHRHSGLLVPPGDAEALAAAMRTLIEDPELGSELTANALARVQTEFEVTRGAEKLAQAFRHTAGLPGDPVEAESVPVVNTSRR